ncbi:MAG: DUF1573 domain-containing protein [Terriglobia bacterium]
MNFLLFFLLLFNSLPLAIHSPETKQTDALAEKLRARVTLFYGTIKRNRWDLASEYVIKDGKEAFENQDRGKIYDFKIEEVQVGRDQQTARVVVGCFVSASFIGVMSIPRETHWKLVDGEWFYDPADIPKPIFQRYSESQKAIKAKGKPDIKFDELAINFGVAAQEKTLSVNFPFTNDSKQEVWIEQISLPKVENLPDYMVDTTKVKSFKPGQKGEIALEVKTGKLLHEVESTIFVEFQPVNEIHALRVKGKVYSQEEIDKFNLK